MSNEGEDNVSINGKFDTVEFDCTFLISINISD